MRFRFSTERDYDVNEKLEDPMKANKGLNKEVLKVVENQIRQSNPPATKETLDRLIREGHDQDEARRLIGCVVASEIFDILKNMEPYDENRYVSALRKLPELPE
jgi:hypothetical protein